LGKFPIFEILFKKILFENCKFEKYIFYISDKGVILYQNCRTLDFASFSDEE